MERVWSKFGSKFYNCHQKSIKIFFAAISIRMAVYLLSVIVMALFGDYQNGITFSDFLEAWKRWDSAHYLNIADNGYRGAIENGEHIFLVFYPLYPWLIKILSFVFKDMRLCGVIISTVCFGIGSVYFVKCVERELGEKVAVNSFIALSLFPFGFFMGSIATESLFYMVCMIFFYKLRNHRYGEVAFWGFLACLTKVQGLLLAFAVLVELFYSENGISLLINHEWKNFWRRVLKPGLLAANMLWGFGVYLLINYTVEGDPFRFMYYQKYHWNNGFSPIWATVHYVFDNALETWFTSTGMALWVPEAILFFVYIWGIYYLYKQKVRPTYQIYLIVFFLLTYSSSWLISAGRYTLCAYPLFMAEALFIEKHPRLKYMLYTLSAVLMTVYYIGYFSWKHIM